MDAIVTENTEARRFELFLDGEVAGHASYRVRDGITVVTHSEVDPRFQGRGLGGVLARQTLDQLRSQQARVIPACPFFAKYVSQHHDWDDILED